MVLTAGLLQHRLINALSNTLMHHKIVAQVNKATESFFLIAVTFAIQ